MRNCYSHIILVLVLLFIVCYFFGRFYEQTSLYHRLQVEGVRTNARVVNCKKVSKGGRKAHYVYQATTQDGNSQEYTGVIEMASVCKIDEYHPMRYLATHPEQHLMDDESIRHMNFIWGFLTLLFLIYIVYKIITDPNF